MRKTNMKRRGRSLKADDSKEDAEEVSNGDVVEKKRKGRPKNADENGENVTTDDAEATDVEPDAEVKKKKGKGKEESSDEPPEAKKKKKSVGKKAESESDEESDTAKKKAGKKGEGDDDEQDGKKKKAAKKGDGDDDEQEGKKKKPGKGKKGDGDDEPAEEYEVEAIIDDKKVRKTRHYLIRWKGFSSEDDTWEPEHTLNCVDLLKKYKEAKAKKAKEEGDDDEEVDEKKEYEVERIVEVHFKRDGKREFLVNWKGYSSNDSTWEPEENLNCPDLISKFMSKVEHAKKIDQRALRTYRPPTERFTLMTNDSGRRMSRRNTNKQRIRYVDCE